MPAKIASIIAENYSYLLLEILLEMLARYYQEVEAKILKISSLKCGLKFDLFTARVAS